MAYEESYSRNYWNNNAVPSIDATNLNNMESGIKTNDVRIVETSRKLDEVRAVAYAAASRTGDNAYYIEVIEDIELTIATYAHVYLVLAFDSTVYNVTFTPSEGGSISWINGAPTFDESSVYEISFLGLVGLWIKR